MALLITNPKTELAVLALAQATGESIEDAIAKAAEARLMFLEAPTSREIDMEKLYALLHEFDALPTLDPRTPDEILGYDEHGLPT